MRTSTLPVKLLGWTLTTRLSEETVAVYSELKPLSHKTRSTWCLLSIFHTSTRKHFQNSRATHIKPCRDCVIWLCVSGRADGVISLIMEAVLSVEKPSWQPDMSACSSLESCTHTLTHTQTCRCVCVCVCVSSPIEKPSKHLVKRFTATFVLLSTPQSESQINLTWMKDWRHVCVGGRSDVWWCLHTLFQWKCTSQLANFHNTTLMTRLLLSLKRASPGPSISPSGLLQSKTELTVNFMII